MQSIFLVASSSPGPLSFFPLLMVLLANIKGAGNPHPCTSFCQEELLLHHHEKLITMTSLYSIAIIGMIMVYCMTGRAIQGNIQLEQLQGGTIQHETEYSPELPDPKGMK